MESPWTSNVATSKFNYAFGNLFRKSHHFRSSNISRLLSCDISTSCSFGDYKFTCSRSYYALYVHWKCILRIWPWSSRSDGTSAQYNIHPGLPPQPAEHLSVLPSSPPTSSTEIDFKALGDRLDAAFTEKLETIAQTLQASWQTARRSAPFDPIGPANSSASSEPTPIPSTPVTSSTLDQHQQGGHGKTLAVTPAKLPIKAKPPLPPKLTGLASKPKATPRPRRSPSLAGTASPRRSRRRPMKRYRSRSRSRRPTGGNHARRGSRPRNHQRSPLPRHGPASRTSRPTSTSPRRFTHPIYARSTMSRRHSPPTRAHRNRPYSGGTRTIRTPTGIDSLTNTGRHHSRLRSDSPNSFRLCSRPREHRDTQRHQRGLFDREPGVHIQAKARPTRPASKSRSPQPEPEPPHTFDESLEMKIPPSVDIPPVDWSQLTPELLEYWNKDKEKNNLYLVKDLHGWTGQPWWSKPMKIQVEQKQLVNWFMQALCAWPKKYAQRNSKHFFEFYTPEIQTHLRWSLGIWLLSLPTLEKWHELKLVAHTPSRCLARLDLDWWYLLFFDQNRDSETILPKYITLYMALQAKELQGSWQKIWFDLEISRCTKTISYKVTFQLMDIAQWEDKQLTLPCHHYRWNTSQRRSWEPPKGLWLPLSMAFILAYIPIKTIEWIAMMKLKYYVENMVLHEDSKTPWWFGLNTLQLVQWFSPTTTKWKLVHQLPDLHHFLPWRAPATLADIHCGEPLGNSCKTWRHNTLASTLLAWREDDKSCGQQISSSTWSWCESPMP